LRRATPLLWFALFQPGLAAEQVACKVVDAQLQGFYEGGCRRGLAHGKGVAKGVATYEGEFRNGLKEGRGVKTWPWGDRYEGEFKADRKDGRGVYTWGGETAWADQRYEGEFKQDARDGWGVYTWPNGDRYEGPWKEDQRLGFSVFEIRRQQAAGAQRDAYRPGVTVCWLRAARETGQVVRGTVDAFDGAVLKLKLAELPPGISVTQGTAVAMGEVVFDDPVEWAPCT
jgi:hypothetical protein